MLCIKKTENPALLITFYLKKKNHLYICIIYLFEKKNFKFIFYSTHFLNGIFLKKKQFWENS